MYSYEYVDSWEKFGETQLPPKEAFYSKLNMKGISCQDYEHAQQVWNRITPEGERVTLGDYHDVYLATDVLLLADVFETFRDTCMEHYKLDPAHFYTAPGLAWKAWLKNASVYCEHDDGNGGFKRRIDCDRCPNEFKLELLTDIDMLLMFEKGIRGGITQAVKRYSKANNKYMGDLYDSKLRSIYDIYMDLNNQFGKAMTFDLPTHNFKWEKNVEKFNAERIAKLVKKGKKGYILEVDVDYPKELHRKHNDFPFLAE